MKLEPLGYIGKESVEAMQGGEAQVTGTICNPRHFRDDVPLYAIPDGYVVVPVGQVKDAERLDYLQHNARCDPKMDGNHIWWPTSLNQARRLTGSSLRTAIDKAMIAAKEQQ